MAIIKVKPNLPPVQLENEIKQLKFEKSKYLAKLPKSQHKNFTATSYGVEYKKKSIKELREILIEKELPLSGNKTTLVKRILDNL